MKIKKIKMSAEGNETNSLTKKLILKTEPKKSIYDYKRNLKIITTYLKSRKIVNFVNPPQGFVKEARFLDRVRVYRTTTTDLFKKDALLEMLIQGDLTIIFLNSRNSSTLKLLKKYRLLRLPVLLLVEDKTESLSGNIINEMEIFNHTLTKKLLNSI